MAKVKKVNRDYPLAPTPELKMQDNIKDLRNMAREYFAKNPPKDSITQNYANERMNMKKK